jgi:hypothetical protein
MTSLGTATQVGQPALSTVSAFIPTVPGTPLGTVTLISFTATPVAPKRYVNVGGTATAIQ